MRRAQRSALGHVVWVIFVVGIGILLAFVVTEGATRAGDLFERVPQKIDDENVTLQKIEEQEVRPLGGRYFALHDKEQPTPRALSYMVADLETGAVLLAKEAKTARPIASVTKLMTAIVAQENLPQSAVTTLSQQTLATEGYRGGFSAGQKLKIEELLYPLLLVSSNDAGEAIARFQGRDRFIEKMNEEAIKLGLTNTSFDDPTGLAEGNVSTAEDLIKLAQYLYQNETDILEISRADYYSAGKQVWTNQNRLRTEETFMGGKTGYTYKAGRTGLGLYEISLTNGTRRPIGIAILNSASREQDISEIIDYIETTLYFGPESSLTLNQD